MIDELSNEDVGDILKKLFAYSEDGEQSDYEKGSPKSLVFMSIKNSIDISNRKYQETCEKNRENAQKRWNKERQKENEEYTW